MLAWIIGVLVISFGFVVFVGPPYLPTLDKQVRTALKLLDLKPGQTLLELGCGDGKVLLAAARQGLQVTGIELNPLLAALCWLRTIRYRKQVRVVWGNYWDTRHWPVATDGIFGFVLPKYMPKLDTIIIQWKRKHVKLASFAFAIPDKPAVRQRHGVFLYEY